MGCIGRGYLIISIIIGISFLVFGSTGNAYAVDYVLSGTTCLPILGGDWDGESTCSKDSTLIFASGNTLTIPNGVTLAFSTNTNLINRGEITNSGTISISGTTNDDGQLRNEDNAIFTNLGTLTIMGTTEGSGWFLNQNFASLINSGTITIDGTSNNSGQLRNLGSASITNSGKIILTGVNAGMGDVSGLIVNLSVLTNSGSISTNNGFENDNINSVLTNSGVIQITLDLNNDGGTIFNDCGDITYGITSGNIIQEESIIICTAVSRSGYEDPTIGKSHSGKQVVENGICIDIRCWTVTSDYYQDFELVEMLSDSTHTITSTIFCQHGVNKCNYVAFGVSPYGTNINDSVWKIILQKDHRDNWTMKVIDSEGYLGEVTSTTQIVNDARYLSASATIEFKKPTPGMILNIEVRDSGGGYRDFKFNDGVSIVDAYAYPAIKTSYEPPLELKPLCLNENSNKRHTCAFEKVRDWAIKNAEATLEQITR